MSERGLVGRCRRRWRRTTIADPAAQEAADLVRRALGPDVIELDCIYVGDITYIWTWEGWAYLASVIDLASRRVVGWQIADHMEASLVCDALEMALGARRPGDGLTSTQTAAASTPRPRSVGSLATTTASESPSRRGQCWDNAVGESWFATLKEELVHRQSWATRAQVRRAVFDYIEVSTTASGFLMGSRWCCVMLRRNCG